MINYSSIAQLAGIPVSQNLIDEWVHRFTSAISECSEEMEVTGYKYDETTKPFMQFTLTRRGVECPVDPLIVPVGDELLALYLGWKAEVEQDLEEVIFNAALLAVDRLGQEGDLHEWSALIGPPVARISGNEPRLKSETELGPFKLSSTQRVFWEKSPQDDFPILGHYRVLGCVPIHVQAATRGYSWEAASVHAAKDLNMLCSLLSVAWGTCIVVRSAPLSASMGESFVPKRDFWEDAQLDEEPYLTSKGKTVPKWTKNAWRVIKGRPKLANAVAIYREGLRAQSQHPSLALVAFIASIEAISQIVYHDDKCTECEARRFISDKFTHTLRLVTDEESAELLGRSYSPRSRTVHQGKLHGTETTVGSMGMSIWNPDDPRFFNYATVYRMGDVSRELLEMALNGKLPQKRRFSSGE